MYKKTILISLFLGILLLLYGCSEVEGEKVKDAKGYSSAFLFEKDYKGSRLEKWIKSCSDAAGYYQFVNSDPDSWDIYIYYPNINPKPEYISYKVDLKIEEKTEGRILKVYLSKQNVGAEEQIIKDLVLEIKAPLRGAWPRKSEVYVDGEKVKCVGQDFQD